MRIVGTVGIATAVMVLSFLGENASQEMQPNNNAELETRIRELESQIRNLVPQGTVGLFDKDRCPPGWDGIVTDNRRADVSGRYVLLVTERSARPVGSVMGTAIVEGENRATGQHTHPHRHTYETQRIGGDGGEIAWGGGARRPIEVHMTGVFGALPEDMKSGTNAPYIQYLVCKKA